MDSDPAPAGGRRESEGSRVFRAGLSMTRMPIPVLGPVLTAVPTIGAEIFLILVAVLPVLAEVLSVAMEVLLVLVDVLLVAPEVLPVALQVGGILLGGGLVAFLAVFLQLRLVLADVLPVLAE